MPPVDKILGAVSTLGLNPLSKAACTASLAWTSLKVTLSTAGSFPSLVSAEYLSKLHREGSWEKGDLRQVIVPVGRFVTSRLAILIMSFPPPLLAL